MSKKTQKHISKNRISEVELKFKKGELVLSILSLIVAIAALVLSIVSINISQSQVEMEYQKNLPNFNMTAISAGSSDIDTWVYQIINDGGNIREATIIPHMYFEMRYCPNYQQVENRYAIEVKDFFASFIYDLGLYTLSNIPYDASKKGWDFQMDEGKLRKGLNVIFLTQELINIPYIASNLSLCFEIHYVDFMGISHAEWYYADYINGGRLIHIGEDSQMPLQTYTNADGINMEDIDLDDTETLSFLAHKYEVMLSDD